MGSHQFSAIASTISESREGRKMSAKNIADTAWIVVATALSFSLVRTAGAQSLDPVQLAIGTSATSNEEEDAFTVVPFEYDPYKTDLVSAHWLEGTGCPTNATTNNGTSSSPLTDAACPSGDSKDKENEGLLLVKTGPTTNDAAAGASLKDVKGIAITELGYDIRTGSHCGNGAPRFNVVTSDGNNHFVGCNSPVPMLVVSTSTGWKRLRWTAAQLALAFPPILPPNNVVKSIDIIFDEGTDATGGTNGPDSSGLAVLDNIDVNGTLVGRGPQGPKKD
jgi:hypothetical protein